MSDTNHRLRPVGATDARQFSPSAARNCVPIREVLTRVLPKKGIALEIGSGTGEHVVCFAKALPRLVWLPSDPDEASRTSIEAWMTSKGLANVRAPGRNQRRSCSPGGTRSTPSRDRAFRSQRRGSPWKA
jgi:tRNA G46 methylase TrmB